MEVETYKCLECNHEWGIPYATFVKPDCPKCGEQYDIEETTDIVRNKNPRWNNQFSDEEVDGLKAKKQTVPSARELLKLEQDYELDSLNDAIRTQNETEIQRSKVRLHEIQNELEALK